MRFLHTSDWHVGKTLKGRSRLDEQKAVLAEIINIAKDNAVDAVLIAGDLYDTAAPSADAQRLVVNALLALRATGAEVIAIAGNHDHAGTFEAYRPLMQAAGISLVGQARSADQGGVIKFTARNTGEEVRVAVLPFLSQRYAVSAAELVANTPADNAGTYDKHVRTIVSSLTQHFTAETVNLVMAHLTVVGGAFGGGERQAQSIFEYSVPAHIFGVEPHYVALGHLHRRQELPAPCPVHYSGAPFAVDFGEQDNPNVVCLVDASPGTPAGVRDVEITSAKRLRTLRGTVAELTAMAEEVGDDYLRVFIREPARAGLREEVEEILPNAIHTFIDPEFRSDTTRPKTIPPSAQRSPLELFQEYLGDRRIEDNRVVTLFNKLHDEATGSQR